MASPIFGESSKGIGRIRKEKCKFHEACFSPKTQLDEPPDKKKLSAERLLKFILFNEDRADVHFLFPNETESVIRLPGHKLILATRSDVFGAQFSGRFTDEDECLICDVSSESFREFLRYLYTDAIEMTKLGMFVELLYLSENVFKLIDKRIDHVLDSQLFLQLPKEVVKEILQRDSLKCNEITIYSGMIKWAEAECKRNDWPVDGEDLRRALDELLHLIRFPTMSGEEFNNGPVAQGLFEGKEAYDLLLCINSLQTKKDSPTQQGEAAFYSIVKRAGLFSRKPDSNWQPPMVFVPGDRHRPNRYDGFGGHFGGIRHDYSGLFRRITPDHSTSEESEEVDEGEERVRPQLRDRGFGNGGGFGGGIVPRGGDFGERRVFVAAVAAERFAFRDEARDGFMGWRERERGVRMRNRFRRRIGRPPAGQQRDRDEVEAVRRGGGEFEIRVQELPGPEDN
ncbi:unnamed protein product, partial [Mesorhabditis belari]|uniref:BTB domain-containing protein n=1 Tax=Mesorhabditis belari TaxID=2138241 RepID=A0AAF3EVY9_9BILA